MEALVRPLPRLEITPPVTKMYFVTSKLRREKQILRHGGTPAHKGRRERLDPRGPMP